MFIQLYNGEKFDIYKPKFDFEPHFWTPQIAKIKFLEMFYEFTEA